MSRLSLLIGLLLVVFVACDGDDDVPLADRSDLNGIVEAALVDADDISGDWCCAEPWIASFREPCEDADAVYQTSRRLIGVDGAATGAALRFTVAVYPDGFGATCFEVWHPKDDVTVTSLDGFGDEAYTYVDPELDITVAHRRVGDFLLLAVLPEHGGVTAEDVVQASIDELNRTLAEAASYD